MPTDADVCAHSRSRRAPPPAHLRLVGLNTDITPLVSDSTTGEFDSPPKYLQNAEKVPELRVVR
eukprot:1192814-Prorocentrum_minimum.AAC.3